MWTGICPCKQASNVKAAKEKNEFVEQDDQLMLQVTHLHTEKVKMERRLAELERENEHLHDEAGLSVYRLPCHHQHVHVQSLFLELYASL